MNENDKQAEPVAWESALEFAAQTIELYDDATMRNDYMLDASECAAIIRALKTMYPTQPVQPVEPVAWRPMTINPIPWITGKPQEVDIRHWASQGCGIEYAFTHPPQPVQPAGAQGEPVTVLPDGSAFAVMSFPLSKDHWLYAERQYLAGEYEPVELGKPILTHAFRDSVISAVRYAIRGATNCGKDVDFDPDALVQNAVYALCGPYSKPKPKQDQSTTPAAAINEHVTKYNLPPLPKPAEPSNGGQCCGNFTSGGEYLGQSETICCGQFEEVLPDCYTAAQMWAYARAAIAEAEKAKGGAV